MLKFIDKIRRHSAIAAGNFDKIFKNTEIPPLPAAISKLVVEINSDEPDLKRISDMITSIPEVAHKVLSTVNSSYFSLPNKINSIKHGVTVLGLKNIKPLVLSFAMKETMPKPAGNLFQVKEFWSDSLVKALFARALADLHCKEDREEAFTAMLLADIALPVLLSCWGEYYEPIVEQWQDSPERLSENEQESFKWDHAQAGAWILQNWDFPTELVCFVGLHNTDREELVELELEETIALPVITAALLPSCLCSDIDRAELFISTTLESFNLTAERLMEIQEKVSEEYIEICTLFDLVPDDNQNILAVLHQKLEAYPDKIDNG